MKSNKKRKTLFVTVLMLLSLSLLAGCGGKKTEEAGAERPEYIYVPEYFNLGSSDYIGSAINYENEIFYYTEAWDNETGKSRTGISKYNFESRKSELLSLDVGEASVSAMQITPDGKIALLIYEWTNTEDENGEYQDESGSYALWYMDPESGEITGQKELSEENGVAKDAYLGSFYIDAQGNNYLFNSNEPCIYVLSGDLQMVAAISLSDYINQMFASKDGESYVTLYGNTGTEIRKIDLTKKALSDPLKFDKELMNINGCMTGISCDFLVNDQNTVYAADVAAGTFTKLFDWLDADVNGNNVNYFGELPDGRIWVITSTYDGNNNEAELLLLEKKKSSEVAQKEEVTLGTLWLDDNVKSAIIDFNKSSDKYHISVKTYGQDDWESGLTQFNADVASGSGPDLVDFSNLNYTLYAEKGVFEDLYPYMEKSGLKKENYVENVLEAYEMDGKLYGFTTEFSIYTIVGKQSVLGELSGWTLSEMMDFIDQHKDSEIFPYASQQYMLYLLVYNNMDEFIDWESGKCSFDGPEFARILEYTKTLPEQYNDDAEEEGEATKLRNNKLLLLMQSVSSVEECQMLEGMMGEKPVYVGYPNKDREGNLVSAVGGCLAISSKSGNKEAAWAFLQTLLTEDYQNSLVDGFGWSGFPILKSALELQFEKDMTPEYYTDENGEQVEQPKTTWGYGNDFEMDIYAAKQEDIDQVKDLIASAKKRQNNVDEELINIISEETEPFFKGQKSASDVSNVIQNRIQVYVNENR